MANTDNPQQLPNDLSTHHRHNIAVIHNDNDPSIQPSSSNPVSSDEPVNTTPQEQRPPAATTRPTLVQLGTGGSQASTPTTHHPPKKFTPVNINRKFLEKNSVSALPASSSSSAANKASGSLSRPSVQSAQSHSRLITTKLTASPAPSITPGGWSRPTSTAPSSTGTSSPIGSSPLPSAAAAVSATGAPQLPHVGKVIQPQPRAALQNTNLQKEGLNAKPSSKPAWGAVKTPTIAPIVTAEDFPTAAEVAQATANRKPKQEETKPVQTTPEAASSIKHRLEEEADTFRGVHLDPNAHHWDEMEEDNDDFLGGVIEFGDGRQYKVEATDTTTVQDAEPVSKEERFVDDFDRSWPKSGTSPLSSREPPATSPALSSRGNSLHGQDPSHPHLFNERSNRLEPYGRSGTPNFQGRRGSHNEGSASPVEFRKGNLQLLQKGNGELPPRPRNINGAPRAFSGSFGTRDREPSSRPPPSPRMSRDGWGPDRDSFERERHSDMGPPSLPSHRRPSQESGRQLPPHLSPNVQPTRRLSSRDSHSQNPTSPQSSRFAPPSPAFSHASTLPLSPGITAATALPGVSGTDLEVAAKDLMQTAAARAKARRQQEEAEREAQRERAKKKALELEEQMKSKAAKEQEEIEKAEAELKAKEAEKEKVKAEEKEAVAFIETAIGGVEGSKPETSRQHSSSDATSMHRSLPRRPPSSTPREESRRPSFGTGIRSIVSDISPASQSDSWRAKSNPIPPSLPTPRSIQTRPSAISATSSQSSSHATESAQAPSTLSTAPSTAHDQLATLTETSIEKLEVIDFSSMDAFSGDKVNQVEQEKPVTEKLEDLSTAASTSTSTSTLRSRPIASDFFEDKDKEKEKEKEPSASNLPPSKSDAGVWRRKPTVHVNENEDRPRSVSETYTNTSRGGPGNSGLNREVSGPSQFVTSVPPPRTSMSTIDTVMSRIKGALDGIQSENALNNSLKENRPPIANSSEPDHPRLSPRPQHSVTKPSPLRERWLPPPKSWTEDLDKLEQLRESLNTSTEPWYPSPEDVKVQLPRASKRMVPVPKRLQHSFSKPAWAPRFDSLSFDPPVEGMRKDFSLNAVLFKASYKVLKFPKVKLPRSRSGHIDTRTSPVARSSSTSGLSAFGRSTNADGLTTWRKGNKVDEKGEERSESPEADDKSGVDKVKQETSKTKEKEDERRQYQARSRPPKMPAGSSVAFYRDSRIDVVTTDPKPLVNFIVTSELDEPESQNDSGSTVKGDKVDAEPSRAETIKSSDVQGGDTAKLIKEEPSSKETVNLGGKASDESTTTKSIPTPPSMNHQTTSWTRPVKDNAVRAPDPEHLRAVWSQTSTKPDLNPVNSLEGIADDLTSVPFSIQDVKSEGGETPPPALPPTTSRMSMREVTEAFQKVPTSSSSSKSSQSRNSLSTPNTTNTPAVRSPYSYSPMPAGAIRHPTGYDHYSPLLSHSPSPTMVYSHQMTSSPVPSRMSVNGHASMYQQPMWMHPPPASGNPANMMRPMMPPYMYGATTTPVYGGHHPMGHIAAPQPPVGTAAGRGRGMPMMNSAMGQAPMYGSPVLMHMQPVQPPQNAYMNMTATATSTPGRGGHQSRTENGLMQPPVSQTQPGQPPHLSNSYNPAFVRSAW